MKTVIDVHSDKRYGTTTVLVSVPEFHNFGHRLAELEKKAEAAFWENPGDISEIEAITQKLNEFSKTNMQTIQARVNGMEDGLDKEGLVSSMQIIQQAMAANSPSQDDTLPEKVAPVSKESGPKYDLQTLEVNLSEDVPWNQSTEAQLDKFLADWPAIRPRVLDATFKFYEASYPQLAEIFDSPEYRITMPEPTSPEVVADLFYIAAIYIHNDGDIGLSGGCTWDEEHGYGVLLRNGEVIEVGEIGLVC